MRNAESNLEKLRVIAAALAHLLPQVTFVGGCTTVLLVDEAAVSGVRYTDDVDAIVDITTTADYLRFSGELRKLGFREDRQGPICRWLLDRNGLAIKLDVMPVSEKILGFSNKWYPDAIQHAQKIRLSGDLEIQVVNPTYFFGNQV